MKEMTHITQCASLCYYACLESILRDMGEKRFGQSVLFNISGRHHNFLDLLKNSNSSWVLRQILPLNIEEGPKIDGGNPRTKDILANNSETNVILVLAKRENGDNLPWFTHAVRATIANDKVLVMDPYLIKNNSGEVFNREPGRRVDYLLERDFAILDQMRKHEKDGLREYFLLKRK